MVIQRSIRGRLVHLGLIAAVAFSVACPVAGAAEDALPAVTKAKDEDIATWRVRRGGAWGLSAHFLHVAHRTGGAPDERYSYGGFRAARTAE